MFFSFEKDKTSVPVCVVNSEIGNRIIYYYDEQPKDGFKKYSAKKGETLFPIPFKVKNQRVCCNIIGKSGSGKSRFVNRLVKELTKVDKSTKNNYLITASTEKDPAFTIDLGIVDIPYTMENSTIEDSSNSNMIFDDWLNSTSKEQDEFVLSFAKQLLERSRKLNTNLFILNHDARNFNQTKLILLESSSFVVFPKTNLNAAIKLGKSYLQWEKSDIDFLKSIDNGRFTFVFIQINPSFWISQDRIQFV